MAEEGPYGDQVSKAAEQFRTPPSSGGRCSSPPHPLTHATELQPGRLELGKTEAHVGMSKHKWFKFEGRRPLLFLDDAKPFSSVIFMGISSAWGTPLALISASSHRRPAVQSKALNFSVCIRTCASPPPELCLLRLKAGTGCRSRPPHLPWTPSWSGQV